MWSPEDNLQCCLAGSIHLVFETGSLAGRKLIKEANLPGWQAPRVCLSPLPPRAVIASAPLPPWTFCFHGFWGSYIGLHGYTATERLPSLVCCFNLVPQMSASAVFAFLVWLILFNIIASYTIFLHVPQFPFPLCLHKFRYVYVPFPYLSTCWCISRLLVFPSCWSSAALTWMCKCLCGWWESFGCISKVLYSVFKEPLYWLP